MASKYIRLEDNVPMVVKFAEVPPSRVDGKFGPQLEYIVNGSQVLTASEYLSDQISAALDSLPPGRPRVLTLTKTKNRQNRTRYIVADGVQPGAQVGAQAGAPARRPSSGAPQALQYQERTFASIVSDYAAALFHAQLICQEQFEEGFTNEDVRSVATTLFIEANRNNVTIPPMYSKDTPVVDDERSYQYEGVEDEELPFEP